MSQTTAHMHGHHKATMGLGQAESRAQSYEPHRNGAGVAPPEISVTKSRTGCDLTQQMVGGIKASSPGMESMSADMFLDLPTMSAPSADRRRSPRRRRHTAGPHRHLRSRPRPTRSLTAQPYPTAPSTDLAAVRLLARLTHAHQPWAGNKHPCLGTRVPATRVLVSTQSPGRGHLALEQ